MSRINRAFDININQIPDIMTRDAIRFLKETVQLLNVGIDQSIVEIDVLIGSASDQSAKNPLGLAPTDITTTWVEWRGTVGTFEWKYSKCTKDLVYFNCTQPALIRGIIGRRG